MKANLPKINFFESFYMWFNLEKKEEYYSTPLYLYSANKKENFDNKTVNVYLEKDISKVKPSSKEIVYKFPGLIAFPYVQKFGMFLMDFLNANFTNFKTAYNTFFYKYGFEILMDILEGFTLDSKYENEEIFIDKMEIIFNCAKGQLEYFQEQMIDLVHYVFNIDKLDSIEDYTPKQRYLVYKVIKMKDIKEHSYNYITINENRLEEFIELEGYTEEELLQRAKKDDKVIEISDIYKSDDIIALCFLTLVEIIKNNLIIKKCINCGMYFIPNSRIDEVYCEYSKGKDKTCREKGALLTYTERLKQNKALAEYRRLYQQKSMAVGRNKDNKQMKKDFEQWKKHAKVQVNKLKHGLLTEDEVYEWLLNNK